MDDSTNHPKPAKQTQDVHILCDWSGSNFQHVSTSGTQENSGTQPQTETNHIHRGSYKRLLRNLHRKKWCTKDFKWTSSETKNNGSPWKKTNTPYQPSWKLAHPYPKTYRDQMFCPPSLGLTKVDPSTVSLLGHPHLTLSRASPAACHRNMIFGLGEKVTIQVNPTS